MKKNVAAIRNQLDDAAGAADIAAMRKGILTASKSITTALATYQGSTAKANKHFKKVVAQLKVVQGLSLNIEDAGPAKVLQEVKKIHQAVLQTINTLETS